VVPLTAARVGQLVSSIACDFGANGSAALSSFGAPERIWWANDRVICARYRLAIGSAGLEAIIDVHAFASNRAFVEVVVENGRVDASATNVTAPSAKVYTNATVAVNGSTIATVTSPTAGMAIPNRRISSGTYVAGGHEPLRAWYCSTWIGGDPAIEVTHDPASLQTHPWFFKPAVASTQNMQTKYGNSYDTYVPWATCRLRMPGMDGGGDDEEIGLFTGTQSDYIITGSQYARRSLLATGQALLSAAFNYRHTDGTVPSPAQLAGKNTTNGRWPLNSSAPRYGGENTADGSHIPATTLVPFLCRPSPCFIEIAQKEAAWNHANYNSLDGSHPYDQERSRGWRLRNYGIAAYLTPDSDATRKTAYRNIIVLESAIVKAMLDQPWNTIAATWGPVLAPFTSVAESGDSSTSRPFYQGSFFMREFITLSYDAVDKAKVLTGTQASDFKTLTDRVCAFVVRWITEATGHEWRALAYQPTLGSVVNSSTLEVSPGSVIARTKSEMSGAVPTSAGPWLYLGPSDFNYDTLRAEPSAAVSYSGQYFCALSAAVERGVAGAAAAWTAVYGTSGNGGITNFSTWLAGYGTFPTFNRWPRNR